MLVHVAGACRSLRFQLGDALPILERLGADYAPVADLSAAIMVAIGSDERAASGTPADLERRALAAIRDLDPDRRQSH